VVPRRSESIQPHSTTQVRFDSSRRGRPDDTIMRILVVSDLHGNAPALRAILERERFDLALNAGDLVDYGPFPAECVRWSMSHCAYTVRGNHDHGVAQNVEVVGDHGYRYLTRIARPFMWPDLGPRERRYLLELPLTLRIDLDGLRILMVHGTPRDPLDEYVMGLVEPWTARLRDYKDIDLAIVGHTHHQFLLDLGEKRVLNPGSVGQPRDGDPRAAYAIIEDGRIQLHRVEYPIEQTLAGYEALGLPEKANQLFRESLTHGRLSPPPRVPTESSPQALPAMPPSGES